MLGVTPPVRDRPSSSQECWHPGLIPTDDYPAAASVKVVRGESESRGRDLSPGELRSLSRPALEPPARLPIGRIPRPGGGGMPPFSIAYGSGVRRPEAIALDVADLDFANGQLRVGQGNGKKPRQAPLAPSAFPVLEDWL